MPSETPGRLPGGTKSPPTGPEKAPKTPPKRPREASQQTMACIQETSDPQPRHGNLKKKWNSHRSFFQVRPAPPQSTLAQQAAINAPRHRPRKIPGNGCWSAGSRLAVSRAASQGRFGRMFGFQGRPPEPNLTDVRKDGQADKQAPRAPQALQTPQAVAAPRRFILRRHVQEQRTFLFANPTNLVDCRTCFVFGRGRPVTPVNPKGNASSSSQCPLSHPRPLPTQPVVHS